ncbi:S-layer homology domain-containing protein [Paenibacillus uliginis N3/975]|uniref:S-layer homology domain-containing protein n=1 Tax=Paenibacillus uliginis N3/975 TaxID=1313296 RepID=A0A1X7HNG8_9BACL|nr:S-layer homology domain-containing protein [Paenibacillus uliginis]SMF89920.1 S-layer homology domain-containing protein [Paenibacillus uliginis N3/975]
MLKLRLFAPLLLVMSLFLGSSQVFAGVTFRDTDNHWAKATIEWGVEKGIVNGYANGTFMPNQNVTEAEFIRMLVVGIAGKDLEETYLTEFWSDKYYNFLHFKNYPVRGFADKKIRSTYITRAQVAELVSSADGVNYSGDQAIQYVLGKKYALGRIKGENTIRGYMGHETITRAEVLQLIKNLTNHGMSNLYDRPTESSPTASLPKLPTEWDVYRDNMYIVIRQNVFTKYSGYRIYDDGDSRVVMTRTKQQGQVDNAVTVQFEPQILSFSSISLSDSNDSTQRNMLSDVLDLYGFKIDKSYLLTKIDSAVKNKKEIQLKVSGKTIVIDPLISSPEGQIKVYYKWWDVARA